MPYERATTIAHQSDKLGRRQIHTTEHGAIVWSVVTEPGSAQAFPSVVPGTLRNLFRFACLPTEIGATCYRDLRQRLRAAYCLKRLRAIPAQNGDAPFWSDFNT